MIKQSIKGVMGHHKKLTLGSTLLKSGTALVILLRDILPYANIVVVNINRLEIVDRCGRRTKYVGDSANMDILIDAAWLWAHSIVVDVPTFHVEDDVLRSELTARNGFKICGVWKSDTTQQQLDTLSLLAFGLDFDEVDVIMAQDKLMVRSALLSCDTADDIRTKFNIKHNTNKKELPMENAMASKWKQVRSAVAVITNDDGEWLILFNKKYDGYTLPGGKSCGNEFLFDTLRRELNEELGISISPPKSSTGSFIAYYPTLGEEHRVSIYAIHKYDGIICNCEPEKHTEMRWIRYDELMAMDPSKYESTIMHALRIVKPSE